MFRKNHKTLTNIIFCAFLSVFMVVYFLNFKIIIVNGPSMEPTLKNGMPVLMSKSIKQIKKDDIIVFEHDNELCIKRIIAVPNDNVELKNKSIYINGVKVLTDSHEIEYKNYTLSSDEYFVLGDNFRNSTDSRDFGPVNINSVKYKGIGK